jgi:hypothetical protein
MFDQVKEAAGIHMSTFKQKDEPDAEDLPLADGEEAGMEDLDLSVWTPMPHQMAQFRKS